VLGIFISIKALKVAACAIEGVNKPRWGMPKAFESITKRRGDATSAKVRSASVKEGSKAQGNLWDVP